MSEAVTIVGGGLAGLTLGIGLRQRGVPVTIWEAGGYPRHRVCGEFISGGGQSTLARLGLLAGIEAAGVGYASDAAFHSTGGLIIRRRLPEAALCISRFRLDEWLAREFQRLGGDLRCGARWVGDLGPGMVRASGRRVEPVTDAWRWFGLKVHARDLELDADLEMHFVPAGYVGLCRLPGNEVNICGLFRNRTAVPDLGRRWREWLGATGDSRLHARLAGAKLDEASFCSVAGLCLRPQRAIRRRECSVGDAVTMIPPVTGNGMSMAFESAELAIGPLTEFSFGSRTWDQTQRMIAAACDRRFSARLRWAGWLQRALFHPPARAGLLYLAARSEGLWRQVFARTR